jgi:putative transposase
LRKAVLIEGDGGRTARRLGEAHRRRTRLPSFREGSRRHFRQKCFASFVLDESHLLTAARYVELNSVRWVW